VFADIGDDLTFEPADETSLTIAGADELPTDGNNLILRAMQMIEASPHHIHLVKNLPVSAGLGGGSANAAAVLRQFTSNKSDKELAFNLGADVPVCGASQTAIMRGIGEDVSPLSGLGQLSAILVNPGVAVSTGAIFKAMDAQPRETDPKETASQGDLLFRALSGTNDMQKAAIKQAPIIADVLRALAQQTGCELARMSGSGATCFGIFRSDAQAQQAAQAVSLAQPNWWVRACSLGDLQDGASTDQSQDAVK
jgi:4-diphosphocytidyl-2-C-methyl-D-erythritol kinase